MSSPVLPWRPSGVSGRTVAVLAAVAAALVAAFVVAPGPLAAAGSGGDLDGLRGAFAEYWSAGDRPLSPALQRAVDYWFGYHLVKGAIAALLLVVLAALAVRLGRSFLRTGGPGTGRRLALGGSGALVTLLGLFALVVVMANVQGAVAPFASLLPMLSGGDLAQAREQLAGSLTTGAAVSPALQAMVDDFGRYHAAMAVVAGLVTVAFVAVAVALWRRFARTPRDSRRARAVWGALGGLSVLLSLAMLTVAVANTTVAADPAPALLAFFEGGW
ncbi:hypothetical protein ACFFX1_52585 [Dactylosporangium sucinum]|uniref:Tat (Twin-arginine translocation) pathway signal sequence n=1 Tax=Dactylosporangium sucinum TaxID=1424081 RepID=A0A917X6H7_9ACTN|nr:hypothetical protein [Dactylosporangium sucinum]GGM77504.1 hypothetical protein GCM10007977_093710 [Dactylosporangium sucinum]GGM77721.1 hypothetical protein GCM10007977_093980 [Dactylosporangium sucinum]